MAGPWERYASQDTTDTPKGPWEKYAAPTVNQTPEQATDAMSAPDKFTRAGVKSLTSGASGIVNLLGKGVEGADPKKLAKLQSLIGAVEERMGVDPTQYKPASEVTGDPNRPFMERLASFPRSVVEMSAPALIGGAAGTLAAGPMGTLPGAVGLTTAATAGPTIDRKREALGLRPDEELPTKAKKEVAAKLGLDAALLAGGGAFTRGLMGPIESTGVKALGESAKRAAQATLVDAGLGADAAASDKVLIEGKFPTASDLAIGAAQGGLPGLVSHAPMVAGRVPGAVGEGAAAAGKAIREPVVNRTFKPLESLEPESRGRVANKIEEFSGNMNAAEKSLLRDVASATSGLDGVTKEYIGKIKDAYDEGVPIKQEWIDAINKADPVAGQAVSDLTTFGSMRELENSALSKSTKGLNPFENFKTRIGDYALAHFISPKLAAAAATIQTGIDFGARGIDKFTGLSDPGKVITEKYAGTASPTQTVAQARAAATAKRIQQQEFRNVADADVANKELDAANLEKTKLEFRKAADKHARTKEKLKQKENNVSVSKFQNKAISSLKLLDALEAEDSAKVAAEEKASSDSLRNQYQIMLNSQRVEEARVANEARAFSKLLNQQKQGLDIRKRSEGASSEDAGLALKLSRLKEKYRKKDEADAQKDELAVAKSITRNNKKTESAMGKLKKQEDAKALAAASKRVAEARSRVDETKNTPRPEVHTIQVHGVEITQPKSVIGDYEGWVNGTYERMDARKAFIDEAKSSIPKHSKQLTGLFKTWAKQGSKLSDAQKSLDRLKSKLSTDDQMKLQSLWNTHDIAWTWKDDD